MKIKQVHAHFLISIGNYSNEQIGFTVEIDEENESVESVVEQLRSKAMAIVGRPAHELYDEIFKTNRELKDLLKKLSQARSQWEATAEFLRTQGIKTDVPSMPEFKNILEAAKVEEETVLQGELDDAPF